ncbi:uncharacterized protein MONBRDRAFT_6338 [Monosiga brevicollis MX1]|uniref:Uncharacterized protein n=1 Tax=Monosiga brevicollis TaxID=81824 RepID=A9UTJ7_MONBE|nr:uncharacterized protein MONBRDRAFT_6338 [Monosiga brevicollis MX1]EDQ91259.1 predicted protein [Monosiga brevicollis MX1]|eukprot:XP_001743681.1 hypothetical protein [Monosiga brevicollis MX1]
MGRHLTLIGWTSLVLQFQPMLPNLQTAAHECEKRGVYPTCLSRLFQPSLCSVSFDDAFQGFDIARLNKTARLLQSTTTLREFAGFQVLSGAEFDMTSGVGDDGEENELETDV